MFISGIWGIVVNLSPKTLPVRNGKMHCIYRSFLEPNLTRFWSRSYELAIFEKLIISVLHSQNVKIST